MYLNNISSKLLQYSLIFLCYHLVNAYPQVEKLPFCSKTQSGAVLVSTLDGTFSKVNFDGELQWQIETEPGPLLTSNIHNLELSNNGQWIRIIPSLTGVLYKFDGATVDPIPISAESLLKSSFKYSDDLVIAGSIEVRTYGLGFNSGKVFYECTPIKCTNKTEVTGKVEDLIVLRRSTQTVRAIELRTGSEKWNFSVGENNIKMPDVSCIDMNGKNLNWNITAVLPEGLIQVFRNVDNFESTWQYKFPSPIVKVWKWNGLNIEEIDLFAPKHQDPTVSPISSAIYVGMHQRQLYVHESIIMQSLLADNKPTTIAVTESKSLSKIPWKPVPASDSIIEDDSTALSILYGSSYVNGNGYFLFTESDLEIKNTVLCENNITIEEPIVETVEKYIIMPIWVWWKEIAVISITTALVFHMAFRYGQNRVQDLTSNTLVCTPTPEDQSSGEKNRLSESSNVSQGVPQDFQQNNLQFQSRYLTDFKTVGCLGKGGFGIVFEVKQKIDECNYALKRITLPNEQHKRERVLREVKALAKLDHQNIVRYFNSWVEQPLLSWKIAHDSVWVDEDMDSAQVSMSSQKRSQSISIAIENTGTSEQDLQLVRGETEGSDFICFERDSRASDDSVLTLHEQNKINWKRPSRKSHSLDLSKNQCQPPLLLYIQMQLCKKESLKDWLEKNPERDACSIRDLFCQIISAVEYVHMQGLIHRDLKPSNILFSLEGQIKVGDFGLAKNMESCSELDASIVENTSLVGHTRGVGTKFYMSPELRHRKIYDYKVDIYSLGVIFFELLMPFTTSMEKFQVLADLKNEKFPKNFVATYPKESKLLTMMLSEDPTKRLTTIGIRARPPFNDIDPHYGKEYHFEMPKKQFTK